MKVITLSGPANTGKSHTINVIYTFLIRDGYRQVPNFFRELGNPKHKDFIDILTKDGLKLGIVSLGDYIKGKGSLRRFLKELEINGCDVVICASREHPKILAAVRNYSSHFIVLKTTSLGRDNDRIVNVDDSINMISYI